MRIRKLQGQARNGMVGVLEVLVVHMVVGLVVHVDHHVDWTMLGGLITVLSLHADPAAAKGTLRFIRADVTRVYCVHFSS